MGSNMAENHPVGFQWVVEAKQRGRQDHPRRPALHAHERAGRHPRAAARRAATSPSWARDRPLHPRGATAYFKRVRRALHERARRSSPRTSATPRTSTACSRAGIPRRARYDPELLAVRGHAGGGRVRAARAGRAHRRAGPRRPRRRARARRAAARATTRCSTRAASSSSCAGTSPATRRSWSRRSAASRASSFLEVAEALCDNSGRERTTRLLLRGRLDAAHGRRAVHPHRLDHPAAAGQHRPAGRRHPGPARPRVDPGLDRHPDALQHPARLPADARGQAHEGLAGVRRAELAARPATGATWAPTRSRC